MSEDIERVAYLFDMHFHYRSKTKTLEGLVSRWKPPLKIESHPDLQAIVEQNGLEYQGDDIAVGFSSTDTLVRKRDVFNSIKGTSQRLEDIARGLEDAREDRDWEEVVDLVYDLVSESESIGELESSLKFDKEGDNQ